MTTYDICRSGPDTEVEHTCADIGFAFTTAACHAEKLADQGGDPRMDVIEYVDGIMYARWTIERMAGV